MHVTSFEIILAIGMLLMAILLAPVVLAHYQARSEQQARGPHSFPGPGDLDVEDTVEQEVETPPVAFQGWRNQDRKGS